MRSHTFFVSTTSLLILASKSNHVHLGWTKNSKKSFPLPVVWCLLKSLSVVEITIKVGLRSRRTWLGEVFCQLINISQCDSTSRNFSSTTKAMMKPVSYCTVAIGNPERHMRKASHCGSKQQQSSHAMIILRVRWSLRSMVHKLISAELPRHDHSIIACSRHIYLWCCSSRTSRSWWITQSTQHHRRGCNSVITDGQTFRSSAVSVFLEVLGKVKLILLLTFPTKYVADQVSTKYCTCVIDTAIVLTWTRPVETPYDLRWPICNLLWKTCRYKPGARFAVVRTRSVEPKLQFRAPAPGIQNFSLCSWTICSISNYKPLHYLYNWLATQNMSVESELKFQAPAPPFKHFWLQIHSSGWSQLVLKMNNIVFTNAIPFVFFLRFLC